jgi:hypothetical protein
MAAELSIPLVLGYAVFMVVPMAVTVVVWRRLSR